jgi:hypothetical protein
MRRYREEVAAIAPAALIAAVVAGDAIAADGPSVTANDCSIAAAGNASNNTLTCNFGLTTEQLRQVTEAAVKGATGALSKQLSDISKTLGVTEEAAKTLLSIVGEQPDVPDQDLGKALAKVAADYKRLEAQIAAISAESPLDRALIKQAKAEVDAGHLQSAGELLEKITRRVATLTGTCTKVEAMGVTVDPKICVNQIMNLEYRDDRVGFTFVTKRSDDAAVVSFSGYGRDQLHLDADDVFQPIDKVVFTFHGSSDYLKAKGSCSFSNPYKGTPAKVSCAAATSEGNFAGEFISDGVSPNVFEAGTEAPVRHAAVVSKPQVIKGECGPGSHIAEGRIGEDLTKKQSRFFCDSAVIIAFGDDPKHRMIEFVQSNSEHAPQIGYGGMMEAADIMTVYSVYLEIGRPTAVTEGACKLFFAKNIISRAACGTKIDKGDRRTVAIVEFNADKMDGRE